MSFRECAYMDCPNHVEVGENRKRQYSSPHIQSRVKCLNVYMWDSFSMEMQHIRSLLHDWIGYVYFVPYVYQLQNLWSMTC